MYFAAPQLGRQVINRPSAPAPVAVPAARWLGVHMQARILIVMKRAGDLATESMAARVAALAFGWAGDGPL